MYLVISGKQDEAIEYAAEIEGQMMAALGHGHGRLPGHRPF
jgi:hypothetical protein